MKESLFRAAKTAIDRISGIKIIPKILSIHEEELSSILSRFFRTDGSFQPLPPPDSQQLMLLFRHKLLQELIRLEKIYPATIEILDRFRHTGFYVYQGPPVLPEDTAAREKLAIYIVRAPISLDRLSYDGANGTVDYRCKSSPGHPLLVDEVPHQNPLEVLASMTDHIPDPGQQLLCYLGWYSNKSRGLRKKAAGKAAAALCSSLPAAELLPEPDDTPYRRACRRTWAQLIKKVYLVSPLICPRCRFPMKIVSFLEDQTVVRKILQHLGLWETRQRPPPTKIPSFPTVETTQEDPFPWAAETVYQYDTIDPV